MEGEGERERRNEGWEVEEREERQGGRQTEGEGRRSPSCGPVPLPGSLGVLEASGHQRTPGCIEL